MYVRIIKLIIMIIKIVHITGIPQGGYLSTLYFFSQLNMDRTYM
jgi:hypothetical protein